MEEQVGIEVLLVKHIDEIRVLSWDMCVAKVLAYHCVVLAFYERVVVGMTTPALGLLHKEFLEKSCCPFVEILAPVV